MGVGLVPRSLPPHVLAATGGDETALRAYILEAAYRVIARRGLAAASTRAIAEEAGLSPGTLYNYFDGHTRLLAKAIVHNATTLAAPVADLASRAGQGSVSENLMAFAAAAAQVLDQLVPVVAASFSDQELLGAFREELALVGTFQDPGRALADYLDAEKARGRIRPDADCDAVAAIIVSLCHSDAFDRHLRGASRPPATWHREIDLITRSITC